MKINNVQKHYKIEQKRDQESNEDQQRAEALQNYLGRMSDLLLDERLYDDADKDDKDNPLRVIGRSLTVAILQRLDSSRKGIVLDFLYTANLITKKSVISLKKADLSEISYTTDASVLEDPFLDKLEWGGTLMYELISPRNFSNIDLFGTNLSKVNFQNAFLYQARFAYANLTRSNLSWAKLVEANFVKAILVMSEFEGAVLNKANLSKATIMGTNLNKAELQDADFTEAHIGPIHFNRKFFTTLSEADLMRANFSQARLTDVDLSNANLCGANFEGAKLEKVILRDAKYDKNTRWPLGFNPPPEALNIDVSA